MNKRNITILGEWETRLSYGKNPYITAWAALSSTGIIGPFFLEDECGDVSTVNSHRYLKMLQTKFIPALRRRSDNNIGSVWFQQHGTAPHTSKQVLARLEKVFGDRFIFFKTEKEWPDIQQISVPSTSFPAVTWRTGYFYNFLQTPKSWKVPFDGK